MSIGQKKMKNYPSIMTYNEKNVSHMKREKLLDWINLTVKRYNTQIHQTNLDDTAK